MQWAKWIIQIEPNNRYYLKIFTPLEQFSLQAFSAKALTFLLKNIPCSEITVIPKGKIPGAFENFLKEAEKMGIRITWEERR